MPPSTPLSLFHLNSQLHLLHDRITTALSSALSSASTSDLNPALDPQLTGTSSGTTISRHQKSPRNGSSRKNNMYLSPTSAQSTSSIATTTSYSSYASSLGSPAFLSPVSPTPSVSGNGVKSDKPGGHHYHYIHRHRSHDDSTGHYYISGNKGDDPTVKVAILNKLAEAVEGYLEFLGRWREWNGDAEGDGDNCTHGKEPHVNGSGHSHVQPAAKPQPPFTDYRRLESILEDLGWINDQAHLSSLSSSTISNTTINTHPPHPPIYTSPRISWTTSTFQKTIMSWNSQSPSPGNNADSRHFHYYLPPVDRARIKLSLLWQNGDSECTRRLLEAMVWKVAHVIVETALFLKQEAGYLGR